MLRVILLTIIFSFIILPQTSQNNSNKISGDEQVTQKDLKNSEEKTDLKLERLENKIDDNYRELQNENQIRQDSVEERMTIYVLVVFGLLGLIGFFANFFGSRAIKQRVEAIVQEKAEKYAERKLDEEIKKKITNEFVSRIIEEKGKKALKDLMSKLEKEGKDILIDQKKQYDDMLSELEKLKVGDSKEPTEEKKEKAAEFSKIVDKVKTEENYTAEDWYWKAVNAHDNKNYTLALKYYTKTIALSPDDLVAYNNRGIIHTKLKNYQMALDDFDKAISLDSTSAYLYNNKAKVYQCIGKYKDAIENYDKAIELDPNFANAYNNRGTVYYELKNFQEATSDYNKSIELEPNEILPYHNLVELYVIQNNLIQAENMLMKARIIEKDLENQVIGTYLEIVVAKSLGKDPSLHDIKLDSLLNSIKYLDYRFDEIEEWLETTNLEVDTKNYLREKTELLKSKMKSH